MPLQISDIQERVRKKRFLIDCFLYSPPLPKGSGEEEALKRGVRDHFLISVILELIIKILYELDRKEKAPYSHDLIKIFDPLEPETKAFFKTAFERAKKRHQELFKKNNIHDVTSHPLEDVLRANEGIIKNFKYDAMGSKANNSADNIFYIEVMNFIDQKSAELK